MKANELRIGNYLRDSISKTELKVIKLTEDNISTFVIDRSKFPLVDGWGLEPIPLTEEWLVKFGFNPMYNTPNEHNPFYKPLKPNNGVEIYPPSEDTRKSQYFRFNVGGIRSQSYEIEVKYVHQLQNLYFALTGEELTMQS